MFCHSRPTPWLAPHNSFLARPPALPASRSLAHFSLTRATCFARSPGLCGSKPVDDFLSTLAVTSACKNDSTGDYDVEFQGTIPCDDAGRAAVIEAVGPATAFTFNFNATGRSSPSFLYGVAGERSEPRGDGVTSREGDERGGVTSGEGERRAKRPAHPTRRLSTHPFVSPPARQPTRSSAHPFVTRPRANTWAGVFFLLGGRSLRSRPPHPVAARLPRPGRNVPDSLYLSLSLVRSLACLLAHPAGSSNGDLLSAAITSGYDNTGAPSWSTTGGPSPSPGTVPSSAERLGAIATLAAAASFAAFMM